MNAAQVKLSPKTFFSLSLKNHTVNEALSGDVGDGLVRDEPGHSRRSAAYSAADVRRRDGHRRVEVRTCPVQGFGVNVEFFRIKLRPVMLSVSAVGKPVGGFFVEQNKFCISLYCCKL